jgi:hypothetical protein
VARVDDVQTDFIELAGRNSDFTVKTRVLKKESLVAISGSDSVEFRAIVQRSLAIKSFEGIAISGEGLPGELALAVPLPAGSLRVRSSTTDISVFSPAQGILFVDLSLLRKAGTYEVKVQARSPDGFTIERYEPQAIQVTIVAAGNFPTAGGYSPGGGGR